MNYYMVWGDSQVETASIKLGKSVQRKFGLKLRKALSDETRKRLSAKLCTRIIHSEALAGAKLILSYIATGAEADITAVNRYAKYQGIQVAYPYCLNKTTMVALIPSGTDSWGTDIYGIPAPKLESSQLVSPEAIDIVLTPCVAFDYECHRLGMGAGVYDRYFRACKNARKLGIAFGVQMQQRIEFDPEWDIRLDAVFTENDTYTK